MGQPSLIVGALAGLLVCYGAFDRAGKARDIWRTLGWAALVIMAGFVASYSLIVLMVSIA